MNEPIMEVLPDGSREWRLKGNLHRLDGPAYIGRDGTQLWFVDGKLHRLDGPAIIWSDGSQEWYLYGKRVDIREIFGYIPSGPLSEEEQLILALSVMR